MILDQKAVHEKITQKRDGEYQQQEIGLAKWEQEANIEKDKSKMVEATIERINENTTKIEADHNEVLEEMAEQSEEK